MFKNSLYYAMLENGKGNTIYMKNLAEMRKYNAQKYGIFFTINGFKERRIKENLISINAWAIDIDGLDKEAQHKKIESSPVPPSIIVESKNGFHVYWKAEDATLKNYKEIVEHRLIPYFNGDIRAKDICRLLRVPGFNHWKDENDPFMVDIIYWRDVKSKTAIYKEELMLKSFNPIKKAIKQEKGAIEENFNNVEALKELSGCVEVNGERFSFKRVSNGYQILVNGKATSSWIDRNGMIGSYDRGGPGILQWLVWYGHSKHEAYKILERHGVKKNA